MLINIEKLPQLIEKADSIFISSDGEDILIQLLDLQQQIEDAIDEAKAKIEAKALELDPNFASIQGDRVKVYYRAYGSKYIIEPDRIADVPKELYNTKIKYEADSKAIDAFINEHEGKVPLGIIEKDREKQLSITLKK